MSDHTADPSNIKPISIEGVERALSKAERYRLLNEPREAESICRDVLAVDPDNAQALKALMLSITDQFGLPGGRRPEEAISLIHKLDSEYEQQYYLGVIAERRAKTRLRKGASGPEVYVLLREAMEHYENAERLSSAGNDDAILRFNTCARVIHRDDRLCPHDDDAHIRHHFIDEDVPLR